MNYKGGISLWALSVSVTLHLFIFAVFFCFRLSAPVTETITRKTPHTQLKQVENFIENEPVIPKPTMNRTAEMKFEKKEIKSVPTQNFFKTNGGKKSAFTLSQKKTRGEYNFRRGKFLPQVEFFGDKTNDRKVCFIVDCSGSMKGLMGRVRRNLKSSLKALQPDQFFNIIFFGGGKLFEFGNGSLIRATREAKERAYSFIDKVQAAGQTNAFDALSSAARIGSGNLKPSLYYFLTDGFDLTNNQKREFAGRLEKVFQAYAPEAKINTIGFWPANEDKITLEKIALNSGGQCIIINNKQNVR